KTGPRHFLAARLRIYRRSPRALQSCAPHPRERRVLDVPRRCRSADRRRTGRRFEHGLLRHLSPNQAGHERLPDVSLLMDRRNFIKLTAITGATTSLAACGSPETHLIRFIPDDELVPGVAEWKPSICPLC